MKRPVTITLGPRTAKPDVIAADFLGDALTELGDAGHSRAVDRVLDEFGIRTIDVRLGPGGPIVATVLL